MPQLLSELSENVVRSMTAVTLLFGHSCACMVCFTEIAAKAAGCTAWHVYSERLARHVRPGLPDEQVALYRLLPLAVLDHPRV
jgi:hypothetical protein